jgi:FAD dependent oxidoreductase TIGR03364
MAASTGYDLAIVGAGIVGLAHAYMASQLGKRVVVIERDAAANGASVRNFGYAQLTGQEAGDCWSMAHRTNQIWRQVVERANIEILQRGLVLAARFPESETVIDAFLKSPEGQGCSRLTEREARKHVPCLREGAAPIALYSPFEIRIESRIAVPRLAAYLSEQCGVSFLWRTSVRSVEPPQIVTSAGIVEAEAAIICTGDDFESLFADRLRQYELTRCKLQMLRIKPHRRVTVETAIMTDLNLARAGAYAQLPGRDDLRARLLAEMPAHLENGVHLIATQSADGSFVVGDSHHYAATPDPFSSTDIDDLILAEFDSVVDLPGRTVTERWLGTYASSPNRWRLTDRPAADVRIVVVTSGTGASTCFGIAEETLQGLF